MFDPWLSNSSSWLLELIRNPLDFSCAAQRHLIFSASGSAWQWHGSSWLEDFASEHIGTYRSMLQHLKSADSVSEIYWHTPHFINISF